MAYRAELYCYFCGHGSGEVLIPSGTGRPGPEQVRAAYASVPEGIAPAWDDAQPRCPRCGGQMFLERFEHEVVRHGDRALKRAS